MRTSSGNYLIKPTELGPVGSPLRHIIYRLSKADLGPFGPPVGNNRTANDLPDMVESTAVSASTHECGLIGKSINYESIVYIHTHTHAR